MQQLLGDRLGLDTSFLREIFLQRLPPNVQMVLVSSPEGTSLGRLVKIADKVMKLASPSVAATYSTPASASDSISTLTKELCQLHSNILRLEKLVNQFSRSRSSPRSTHLSSHSLTHPLPTKPDSDLCWYHFKFSEKAQHCWPPCALSGNYQASH